MTDTVDPRVEALAVFSGMHSAIAKEFLFAVDVADRAAGVARIRLDDALRDRLADVVLHYMLKFPDNYTAVADAAVAAGNSTLAVLREAGGTE